MPSLGCSFMLKRFFEYFLQTSAFKNEHLKACPELTMKEFLVLAEGKGFGIFHWHELLNI